MQRKWWAAAALATLVLVSGCHKGGGSSSTSVRFLNAVVDAEPLDVLVDDSAKSTGIALGSASAYADYADGARDVKIRSSTSQAILVERTITFNGGTNSTLVAFGKRASISTLLISDDIVTAPPSGQFQIRAIGLSADVGAVDIYLGTGDIAAVAPTITAVTFGATTTFTQLNAGSFTIVATASGTKDVLFQSASQSFAAGASPTIALFPASGGKLVNLMLLSPAPSPSAVFLTNPSARVKAVNAVPDSTALTFKANGATLLSSVPFAASSSYVVTNAGARTFSVEASNVPGATLTSLSRTLDSAKDYTVVAANKLAQVQLVSFTDDNTVPNTGFVRVRFANAMADAASVDALVNFASQATGIAFGTASAYYQVAAATDYTITFATPGGVQSIATLSPVQVDAGNIYTFYLLGTAATPQVKLVRDR
jgi:hypothetical protein